MYSEFRYLIFLKTIKKKKKLNTMNMISVIFTHSIINITVSMVNILRQYFLYPMLVACMYIIFFIKIHVYIMIIIDNIIKAYIKCIFLSTLSFYTSDKTITIVNYIYIVFITLLYL